MYDMSFNSRGSEISSSSSMSTTRSLSEISETETIRLGLDLVSAARRNVRFLRAVDDSQWLHQKPVVIEAIRRSKLASFSSNAIRRWLLWDVNQMLGFFLLQVWWALDAVAFWSLCGVNASYDSSSSWCWMGLVLSHIKSGREGNYVICFFGCSESTRKENDGFDCLVLFYYLFG